VCFQNEWRLATGWTVRGSNPGGDIFRRYPDPPWSPPSPLYNGYWVSFAGVKLPVRGVDPPPRAEVKVRGELTRTHPLGLRGLFWSGPYLYT